MPVSQAGPSKYQRVPDGYWILDTGQEIFAIANAVQTPVSLLIVRKQIYIVCYIVSQINTITNIGVNVGRKKAQGSAHLECILGRYTESAGRSWYHHHDQQHHHHDHHDCKGWSCETEAVEQPRCLVQWGSCC